MSDPVRERRARVARLAVGGTRLGYLLFAVATVVLVTGLATNFSETVAGVVVACLVTGSVVLAPAMILGYATRAAERQDRERGL
ncbi:MAG: hypothetical protein M3535_09275 [Actinomycetota bacterium]|jgi:sugar phosphate permease|nr:hypothetical protein [Actinomycetota bacterium]